MHGGAACHLAPCPPFTLTPLACRRRSTRCAPLLLMPTGSRRSISPVRAAPVVPPQAFSCGQCALLWATPLEKREAHRAAWWRAGAQCPALHPDPHPGLPRPPADPLPSTPIARSAGVSARSARCSQRRPRALPNSSTLPGAALIAWLRTSCRLPCRAAGNPMTLGGCNSLSCLDKLLLRLNCFALAAMDELLAHQNPTSPRPPGPSWPHPATPISPARIRH